jgi:hypothetical protein
MQTLNWYLRRAKSMTPAEIAWRVRGIVRDATDRARITLGWLPSADGIGAATFATPFRLSDVVPGEWQASRGREAEWLERLTRRADRLMDHRMSFFDLDDLPLGSPIQWNFDYARMAPTPVWFSSSIDYRDYKVTGDCKVVWEPSRHHQLFVLARAYRASGDTAYAREIQEQMLSWIAQCPFGRGMQWRSPLELAIRLINWIWAYDLIQDSGVVEPAPLAQIRTALLRHVWDISRKFSRGSSANNHLIGEAAGVFVATCYFPDLPDAARLRRQSQAILEHEILAQSHADGGGREQAFGYHGFVLQFFVIAAVVAKRAGHNLSGAYWTRLERMLEFACRMLEAGPPPAFGDADDGYVLDMGSAAADMRDVIAVGAVLLERPDFKAAAAGNEEAVRWLLGRDGLAAFDALALPRASQLEPHAFPDTGYYLLQCGEQGQPEALSVLFDCGELGLSPIAAHGHADALSFTVRAFGADLLVDPGTYDYFTFPEWRNYFRSTRAHNTLTVDDADQSTMLGPFLWGERARVSTLHWRSDGGVMSVAGSHDGFSRLNDPVTHVRELTLDAESRTLTIRDELNARDRHRYALFFHLAEECEATSSGGHVVAISAPGGSAELSLDPSLSIQIIRAGNGGPAAWVSRGYHRRRPSTTIVASTTATGSVAFLSTLAVGRPQQAPRTLADATGSCRA